MLLEMFKSLLKPDYRYQDAAHKTCFSSLHYDKQAYNFTYCSKHGNKKYGHSKRPHNSSDSAEIKSKVCPVSSMYEKARHTDNVSETISIS